MRCSEPGYRDVVATKRPAGRVAELGSSGGIEGMAKITQTRNNRVEAFLPSVLVRL